MAADPFLQSLPSGSDIPAAVRHLHETPGRYAGRCHVVRGRGRLVALALRLGRFPSDADDIPVQVNIVQSGDGWLWSRDFDGHRTHSLLTFDHAAACIREKLGWITLWLTPEMVDGRLLVHIRALSILGLRCPRFLLPRSSTAEWQDEKGRFCFDVAAQMPGLGLLIRYKGWLTPVHAALHPD